MFLGLALAFLTAATPCGQGRLSASLGERVDLKPGQEFAVRGEDLRVRFLSVLEDSRCPKGEQCLVAGRARISLGVGKPGEEPKTVELETADPPRAVAVAGYAVTLVALAPFPVSGHTIAARDYVATLVVSSAGADLESAHHPANRHRTRTPHASGFWLQASRRGARPKAAERLSIDASGGFRPPFKDLNPAYEFP